MPTGLGLLWCLWLFILPVTALANASPLQLGDDLREVPVGYHLQLLEDAGGTLTLSDAVEALKDGRFAPVSQPVPSKGFSASAWWGYFRLQQEDTRSRLWFLDFSYVPMQQLDVHVLRRQSDKSETIEHYRAGTSVPVAERAFAHRTYAFPLELDPGEILEVYVRVGGESSKIMPLELVRSDRFAEREANEYLLFGVHIGILVGLAIYNLFLFVIVRDVMYAVYVVSVVTALLFFMSLTGVGSLHLWPGSSGMGSLMVPLSMGLSVSAAALFCAMFLDTCRHAPWLHRLLLSVSGVALLSAVGVFFLPYKITIMTGMACTVIGSFGALAAGLVTLRLGLEEARYYMVAWTLFLVGAMALVLKVVGILPPVFVVEYGMFIGSSLECTFLSVALAARMKALKREKEIAQQDALRQKQVALDTVTHYSRKLEEEVRKRTGELLDTQRKLVAHEKRAALGVFTAGMAHEINNPANVVSLGVQNASVQLREFQSFVEDIVEEGNSELVHEFSRRFDAVSQSLELVQGGVGRIDTVVRKLRATHPEGREGERPVDVIAQLEDTCTLLGVKSTIKVNVVTRFEARPLVTAQLADISEIFLALLGNAMDALHERAMTDPQHPAPTLTLCSQVHGQELVVSIADNGVGIPAAVLDKIFDPFFTTKDVGKGSGLGLSMVRDTMQKQAGRVDITSHEGEGTVVSLVWPIAPPLAGA
jgi:two-component system NtrC family sensor kinase